MSTVKIIKRKRPNAIIQKKVVTKDDSDDSLTDSDDESNVKKNDTSPQTKKSKKIEDQKKNHEATISTKEDAVRLARSFDAGPQKNSNIRTIAIIDYQPDLCKDYNQTGFCGYGDSCKFLHDRGEHKNSMQLEKEWLKNSAARKVQETKDEEEKEAEGAYKGPKVCFICRKDYSRPLVVTSCSHYFHEACAIERHVKKKRTPCAVCGVNTNGIFRFSDGKEVLQ